MQGGCRCGFRVCVCVQVCRCRVQVCVQGVCAVCMQGVCRWVRASKGMLGGRCRCDVKVEHTSLKHSHMLHTHTCYIHTHNTHTCAHKH